MVAASIQVGLVADSDFRVVRKRVGEDEGSNK